MSELILVAAAALLDPQGRVLIAQRHPDAHQGGLWEFPGGKCEPGESVEQALRRELREEIGVEVQAQRRLIRVIHHYPDRSVCLDVRLVQRWRGDPVGLEGQPLAWVQPSQLDDYAMPAADRPIARALQLPARYLITPASSGDPVHFLRRLKGALQAGGRLFQFRLFDLSEAVWEQLARDSLAACREAGAAILFNTTPERLPRIGADGLHLSSRQLYQLEQRPADVRLLAASCHNAADLERAAAIGADFALLSPVLPTPSHPDAAPLGWERFGALVEAAGLPVYALGGMRGDLIEHAWQAGAQGVAGIRGIWPEEPTG